MTVPAIAPDLEQLARFVDAEVAPLADALRELQDTTGAVVRDHDRAADLLRQLAERVTEVGSARFAEAFGEDVERWIERGLDQPPAFDTALAAYAPPPDGEPTFFAGPLVATNGPPPRGRFVECFLALREEPEECYDVARVLPHPKNKCQSARLLAGSHGLITGNCIVFFPENVATEGEVTSQTFATFFFNKFQKIYLQETMPRVERLLGRSDWPSAQLAPDECYRVRSVWGYLHDCFHHRGPRPFDENMKVKMRFNVGLLEEIKVDCQSAVAAHEHDLPWPSELTEFILFERMFRYPGQPDAKTNFDAGTGVLLFEWLLREGAIRPRDGRLELDVDACLAGMRRLAGTIEALEEIEDDGEFGERAVEFVRTLVPEGRDGDRFALPDGFARYASIEPSTTTPLDFHDLAY